MGCQAYSFKESSRIKEILLDKVDFLENMNTIRLKLIVMEL